MCLRGFAKCIRNIQQFNFFVHFPQEIFQINFFYAGSNTRCSRNSDIKMINTDCA